MAASGYGSPRYNPNADPLGLPDPGTNDPYASAQGSQHASFGAPSSVGGRSYATWQEAMNSPEVQRVASQYQDPRAKATVITQLLQQYYGLDADYRVDERGNIVDAKTWLERNAGWLGVAGIVGSGALGAAFGGGSAGTGVGAGSGAGAGSAAAGGIADLGAVNPAAFGAAGWTPGLGSAGGAGGIAGGLLPSRALGPGYAPAVGGTSGQSAINAALAGGSSLSNTPGWQQLLQGPLGKVLAAAIPAAIGFATRPDGSNVPPGPGANMPSLTGANGLLNGASMPQQPQIPPELQQLLGMATQRVASQNPLFNAVTAQAFAGLPGYVKGGG